MFVEKIAGHYAEKGADLKAVAAMAQKAADSLVSLGISLSSCTLPGIGREDRVPDGKAELGLGLHGEPGVDLVNFEGARQAALVVLDRLFAAARPARSYALLVNNLGSTTALEMNLLTNEVLASRQGARVKLVLGPAMLVSSLDMHGFSLSLLPLTPDFERALLSPTSPLVWPPIRTHAKPRLVKLPREMKGKPVKSSKNRALSALVSRACKVAGALLSLPAIAASKMWMSKTASSPVTPSSPAARSASRLLMPYRSSCAWLERVAASSSCAARSVLPSSSCPAARWRSRWARQASATLW